MKYDHLNREELLDKVVSFEQELKGYVDRLDRRYEVFFERNLAGMYRSKLDGKIVECNDALAQILGYGSREELIGSNAKMLYQKIEDREKHLKLLNKNRFVKNRKLALAKKDGTKIWVSVSTSQIENPGTGNVDYMEGTIIDISELIHTQELLERNEKNYKDMLDQSPYGIIIYKENKIAYFNFRAEKILRTNLKKTKGKETFSPDFLVNREKDLKLGDIKHFVGVEYKNSKESIYLDVYLKPILFENREMTEMSFVDVRDRIDLEEEKIKTEVFQKLNNQLKEEIESKERVEKELKKILELNQNQAAKLEAIFENRSHIIWTIDKKLRFTSFNTNLSEMFLKLFGKAPKKLDNPFLDFRGLPKNEARKWKEAHTKAFKGELVSFSTEMPIDQNKTAYYQIFLNPIISGNMKVEEVSGIGHDITEKTLAGFQLTESLKEKDILLKEVHHRVKNNLQVISSIFNLQSAFNHDDSIREVLKESQNRIKSMAYIHESLYKSSLFGKINFEEYLRKLCKNLIQSYTIKENSVSLLTETEKVLLHLDQAIPCGLMVNEIISNSLKHAFPDGSDGIIAISLKCKGNKVFLKLSDDGIGIPEKVLEGETNTLGIQLIETLVEQIRGELKIDTEIGSSFNFEFELQQ